MAARMICSGRYPVGCPPHERCPSRHASARPLIPASLYSGPVSAPHVGVYHVLSPALVVYVTAGQQCIGAPGRRLLYGPRRAVTPPRLAVLALSGSSIGWTQISHLVSQHRIWLSNVYTRLAFYPISACGTTYCTNTRLDLHYFPTILRVTFLFRTPQSPIYR